MNIYTHIAALFLGVFLTLMGVRSCGEKPEIKTETVNDSDTSKTSHFEPIVFPEIKGEAKAKLEYVYLKGNVQYLYDTAYVHDTITAFVATLDTIQKADTLHLEFSYPSAMFSYKLNRQRDSVEVVYTTITNTTTNTVTIQPPKLSFGLQFGVGYLVSFRTGQNAIGGYFGVGGNYRL